MNNQYTAYYVNKSRTINWYKKLFQYTMEVCLVNSCIIYNPLNKNSPLLKYKIAIIEYLLGDIELEEMYNVNKNRLKWKHFPEELDSIKRVEGIECSNRNVKRFQTYNRCEICKVGLWIGKCFKDFHTKINYKKDIILLDKIKIQILSLLYLSFKLCRDI